MSSDPQTDPHGLQQDKLTKVWELIEPLEDTVVESATAPATDIGAIVSDELKYELESSTKPDLILLAGWVDTSEEFEPGAIAFAKQFGKEYVGVKFRSRGHGDGDAAEGVVKYKIMQPQPESMKFKVWVSNDGSDDALIDYGKSINILRVSFGDEDNAYAELYEDIMKEDDGNPPEDEDEEITYKGLLFSEPDKRQARMQEAFKAYLEERGVNAKLGRLLMNVSWDKERTLNPPIRNQYIKWLLGVQEFLEE